MLEYGLKNNIFAYRLFFVGLSFLICYFLYILQASHLPSTNVADANYYINMANNVVEGMKEGVRTYGYPLFLKIFSISGVLFNVSCDFNVLLLQYSIYAAASLFLAISVTENKDIQNLIFFSLLFNVLLLSYFSITLTESISVSLLLTCYGIFCHISKTSWMFLLLGLVAAYAVEVRPSNIWFYSLFVVLLFLHVMLTDISNKKKIYGLFLFFVGSLISFLPQFLFNYIYFNKLTPFPAIGLGALQIEWGKTTLKISFESINGLVTQNPFAMMNKHFTWFSLDGISYALLKLFGIFSHDTLFTYKRIAKKYQYLVLLFSSFCVYFGFFGIYFQRKVIPSIHMRSILIGVGFLTLLFIPVGLEDRFTLPLFILCFPFAIYQCLIFFQNRKYGFLCFFAIYYFFINMINGVFMALSPAYINFINSGL